LGRARNGHRHRHGPRRNSVRHQPDDIIKGEDGGDRLFGGDGRDTLLVGGSGKDKRDGVAGNDRVDGDQGDDAAAAISDFVWNDLNRIGTIIGEVSSHH
jgi:Ca2+-binding RTX toxin-like protein